MESISNLSQTDFFALMGILIFLIAVGLILPFFFIDDHKGKMSENTDYAPKVYVEKDSQNNNEKE